MKSILCRSFGYLPNNGNSFVVDSNDLTIESIPNNKIFKEYGVYSNILNGQIYIPCVKEDIPYGEFTFSDKDCFLRGSLLDISIIKSSAIVSGDFFGFVHPYKLGKLYYLPYIVNRLVSFYFVFNEEYKQLGVVRQVDERVDYSGWDTRNLAQYKLLNRGDLLLI